MRTKYDVVILGAGHNGLVAAAYLARAGLSVLMLEKNDYLGGATTSQKLFPDYDARLSRYAYLVSLFPEKISKDLNLDIMLSRRSIASFTPYQKGGRGDGLLLSNVSECVSRASMFELTGNHVEFEQLQGFYGLAHLFAEKVWDTMLQPLPAKAELCRLFSGDTQHREAWRSLVEEPLGRSLEKYLSDDIVRGLVFTDAKIGLLTHPSDESLLQNRCFIYHLIGNKTGEWKVPVGGMGRLVDELEGAAVQHRTEIKTRADIQAIDLAGKNKTVKFQLDGIVHEVGATFLLVNFGANVLAKLLSQPYGADATHEGSVFKINMLCQRLPELKAGRPFAADAFAGTFHIHEGYEEMKSSYRQASQGSLPDQPPCEVYCHTLTDGSILSPELRRQGFHTLTLFGLDVPWRLFAKDHQAMKRRAEQKFLEGLNRWLAEPIQDVLARDREGKLCMESKSPVDLEEELGLYRGNIFHRALTFPFAETETEVGQWGVETPYDNVFLCGSSARRGGAVSGIPGHNAAMKVLQQIKNERGSD